MTDYINPNPMARRCQLQADLWETTKQVAAFLKTFERTGRHGDARDVASAAEALRQISAELDAIDAKLEGRPIKQGDQVRSFDFSYDRSLEGPRACYVEGRVEAIGSYETCHGPSQFAAYEIRTTRRVFAGVEIAIGGEETIHAPVNGTRKSTGGVCDGVEIIAS